MKRLKILLCTVSLIATSSLKAQEKAEQGHKQQEKQATKTEAKVNKKEQKKEEPKLSKYDKLFKDKKYHSAKGELMSFHKMDNKLYLELPKATLGEDLLLGVTLSSLSDPDFLSLGMKNQEPLHIRFAQQDSMVVIKQANTLVHRPNKMTESLSKALDLNYQASTLIGFPLVTYNNDSTAMVLDVTNFLARPNRLLQPIPEQEGYFKIQASPQSHLSYIEDLKAFETNASVKAKFSYKVNVSFLGARQVRSDEPMTVGVTYSFLRLPKEPMVERFSDSRVGIFSSTKLSFTEDKDQSASVSLAHRWRLEPKDLEAFKRGRLTEPKKKITFYLEDTFPLSWRKAIKSGVLRWNKAFEEIGFRNAVEILDFPKDDLNFDPDNLAYSCIRYVPNATENAMGPSWVDPRSGEIINASVIVYNNIKDLLYKWRFIQTSNADKRMRQDHLPKKLFEESLAYVMAHEVGHTLGLMHNMSASSVVPTESLRSARFTKKHGTTYSIMDYARFNYVAQPEDRGVSFTPPYLGLYDYHAIAWNYRYFPHLKDDAKAQALVLEKIVDKKVQDPIYRYGRQQWQIIDPAAVTEDLGDDPIKSGDYGLKNLHGTLMNLQNWIKNDEDSRKKRELNQEIAQKYHAYVRNVLNLIGGIYVNDSKESSGIARHQVVAKDKQKQAVKWIVERIRSVEDFSNRDLEKRGFVGVSHFDRLASFMTNDLLTIKDRVLLAHTVDNSSYSLAEYYDDLFHLFFDKTKDGSKLNASERTMQASFVKEGCKYFEKGGRANRFASGLSSVSSSDLYFKVNDFLGYVPEDLEELLADVDLSKFGNPNSSIYPSLGNVRALDNSQQYYYGILLKLKPILERAIEQSTDFEDKAHYEVLLFKVTKALNTDN